MPAAAASILEAVSDEARRREKCDSARDSAIDRFSIAKTVQGTIRVYESVVA